MLHKKTIHLWWSVEGELRSLQTGGATVDMSASFGRWQQCEQTAVVGTVYYSF